jgi:transcriptional regulator with XRE-family HTH domain
MVASLKLRRDEQRARRKFGPALAAAREARGFSLPKFADEIGRSPRLVARWEAGLSTAKADDLGPMCEALGVSAETLLGIFTAPDASQLVSEAQAARRQPFGVRAWVMVDGFPRQLVTVFIGRLGAVELRGDDGKTVQPPSVPNWYLDCKSHRLTRSGRIHVERINSLGVPTNVGSTGKPPVTRRPNGDTRMTDTRKTEAQLQEQAHGLGYRMWTRRDDAGAVIYHVNHGGNHNHAHGLRTLGQVQDWLGSAEPASDDCPLFEQEPREEDAE